MALFEQGILYCAMHNENYLIQAYLSARSAKRHLPTTPIVLFTDLHDSPLAQTSVFDDVVRLKIDEDFSSDWATGKLPRIAALRQTPFKRTLHLDCDTRVKSDDVASVFDLLRRVDIALVECSSGISFSRARYHRPIFNAGVIAYRSSGKMCRMLGECID